MSEHRNPLTVKSFIQDRKEVLDLLDTVSLAADWVGSTHFQDYSSTGMKNRLTKLGRHLSNAMWDAGYYDNE